MDKSARSEVERLEQVAAVYDPSDPTAEFDYFTKRLHVDVMRPWLIGQRVLEMGCATGELTTLLAPSAHRYEVVEGSMSNIERARIRVPSASFVHSLWEDFEPEGQYSDILLICALEHVEDPVAILERAKGWLARGGRLHIVVPNADSLHRYVGVELGLLSMRTELSESDHRIGHRRVYSTDTLFADVRDAGLRVEHWDGVFLKILSNEQMLGWDEELIMALHRVGSHLPGHCAEIYAVATAS